MTPPHASTITEPEVCRFTALYDLLQLGQENNLVGEVGLPTARPHSA